MYNWLFYLFLFIIILDFIVERFLDYLNTTALKPELPPEGRDIYDEEKYRKSQLYKRENDRFGLLTSTLSFVIILFMLIFGGFAWLNSWVTGITENPIWSALLFFGILGVASDILSTPFSVYHTFRIEEKYGFNTTTPKTFIFDKIKGWVLSAILGGGVLALIVWFYTITGEYFWLYAWLLVTGFTVFMSLFYSSLIVPLFNKQTPLEEGELRNAIEDFARQTGFDLKNIYVIDGSKRSTKANAYFTGMGRKKRIVLYDTLINDLTKEEIVAVLAHEIGHYKKHHTITGLFLSVIQTGITLYLLSLLVGNPLLSEALGAERSYFHLSLLAFAILYSPVSMIIGIFMNILSRKHEYQADAFAAHNYNGIALIEALKKLTNKNLSNLTPHPLYVFFYYSHPPLLSRMSAMAKYTNHNRNVNQNKELP